MVSTEKINGLQHRQTSLLAQTKAIMQIINLRKTICMKEMARSFFKWMPKPQKKDDISLEIDRKTNLKLSQEKGNL